MCKYLEIFKDYNWRNIYVFEFESNDVYSVINQTMCNVKSILIPQIDHAQIDRLYNDIVTKNQNNYINSETNNIESTNQTETTSNTKTYSLKQLIITHTKIITNAVYCYRKNK